MKFIVTRLFEVCNSPAYYYIDWFIVMFIVMVMLLYC